MSAHSSAPPIRLSVCLIVKNEERFLGECLASIRPVADQIVVVDTGSTDRTETIAGEYGVELYRFEWCDDFAAARNESIRYAQGDWILWLDADERLTPESIPVLRQLLVPESGAVVYDVRIMNQLHDGHTCSLSKAHRLFTNRCGLSFSGRIHEQLIESATRAGAAIRDTTVTLLHLGYGLSGQEADAKQQRNRRLLLKSVQSAPQNAYFHFTLAQHYALCKEYKAAYPHYLQTLKLNQLPPKLSVVLLNALSDTCLKIGRRDEAIRYLDQSLKLWPTQIAAFHILYKNDIDLNDDVAAIRHLENIRTNLEKIRAGAETLTSDLLFNDNQLGIALGVLYYKTGDYERARQFLTRIEEPSPVTDDWLKRLVDIHLHLNDLPGAENYLNRLIQLSGSRPDYLKVLGNLLLRQQKNRAAIDVYEQVRSSEPDNPELLKLLAGLYVKEGDLTNALRLLHKN